MQAVLLATLRQAQKHPRYVGLNVLGLALGLCVFLLLSQFVRYEHSYNRSIADSGLIARLDNVLSPAGRAPAETASVAFYALPFLRDDIPEIAAATLDRPTTVMLQAAGRRVTQNIDEVDSDYLKTIPLKLLRGDPLTALARPDGIVISSRVAIALFGTADAIGRPIVVGEDGLKTETTVTGILAPPTGPVTIDPGALMQVPAKVRHDFDPFLRWSATSGSLYLRFRSVADMRRAEARMPDFLARRASGPGDATDRRSLGPHPDRTNRLMPVPLDTIHFHDIAVRDASDGADPAVIDSLGAVGVLALVLAIANSINLATARGTLRAREVAMRKTLGASRSQLFVQFMGESLLLTAFAGIVALSLRELLLPTMAAVTATRLPGDYAVTLAVLGATVLVTGLAAGLYPALGLSSWRPAAVLAASKTPSGGRGAARVRNALVLGQFVLAALIAICTLVVNRQAAFIRSSDLGYDRHGLLLSPQIPEDDAGAQHRVLDALRAVPGVQSATLSVLEPNISISNFFDVHSIPGEHNIILTDVIWGDYAGVYHPHLLAGRWFDAAYGQDDSPGTSGLAAAAATGPYGVVLNLRAVTVLGFASAADAIGQTLRSGAAQLRVIGVEDDIRFVSPRQQVSPLVVLRSSKALLAPVVSLRFAGVAAKEMQARLRAVWDRLEPDTAGDFDQVEDRTSIFYQAAQRQGHLFTAGSAVAILIACTGLRGLAAFAGARRRQEVGIRKTLGATTMNVVSLMLREFLTPVLLACAIACPLAWGAMRSWLAGFNQRIALSPGDFLIVVISALAIASLTVLGQTLRVARAAPAYALRAE